MFEIPIKTPPNLSALFGGDIMAGTRLVRDWIGKKADGLTDNDLAQIGKILVSENPVLVRRALFQPALLVGAAKRTNQIADAFIKTAAGTATRTAGTDVEKAKQGQPTAIKSILGGMSDSAKQKVRRAVPQ